MNPRGTTGFALFLVNGYSGVLDSLICAAEIFLFCLFFDYSLSSSSNCVEYHLVCAL